MPSVDRPSMTTSELTIDSEPQSSASTTPTSQNGRMEILELDLIVSDDELKVRFETDQQTIHDYYEAMETEEDVLKFPPSVVYFDGFRYWLADGHHRYWAIFRRGFKKVLVKVIDGTHDDAVLAAVKLNSKNGLRFNDDDWEKIIPLISQKEQWKHWSNRKLAAELNCSHSTVNKYRPENSVGSGLPTEKRQGKDGKMYRIRKSTSATSKKTPPASKTVAETESSVEVESPVPQQSQPQSVAINAMPSVIQPQEMTGNEKILQDIYTKVPADTIEKHEYILANADEETKENLHRNYWVMAVNDVYNQLKAKESTAKSGNGSDSLESPLSDESTVPQRSSKDWFPRCSPIEFVRDIETFYPKWFLHSVGGILFSNEQEERQRNLKKEPWGRVDSTIYSLFGKLEQTDQKETFFGLFEKLLTDMPDKIPSILKDIERKHQQHAAKSESDS